MFKLQVKAVGMKSIADDIRKQIVTDLNAEAPKIQNEIINRTISGVDATGRPFAKYSNHYARVKAKLGVGSTPNLKLTGAMLSSISYIIQTIGSEIVLTFRINGSFNQQKAAWNQGGNPRIPARNFFALSAKQVTDLIRKLTKN